MSFVLLLFLSCTVDESSPRIIYNEGELLVQAKKRRQTNKLLKSYWNQDKQNPIVNSGNMPLST